jgi:glycosyltransferase involved in cell wall biosynthesis
VRILVVARRYQAHDNSFAADDALAFIAYGDDVTVVACVEVDRGDELVGRAGATQKVRIIAPRGASPVGRLAMLIAALSKAVVRHPVRLWRLVRAIRRRTGSGLQLLKKLRIEAPILVQPADVVYMSLFDLAVSCVDVLALLDAAIVVGCHGSDLRVSPLRDEHARAMIREVFERVDLVHCMSEDLRQHALALGLDPSKAWVGQLGVDTNFFRPAAELDAAHPQASNGCEPRPFRVVSIGRLHWVKGYELAIQALAGVEEAGVEISYEIIGRDEGALLSVLTTIHHFGLEDRVHVRGPRSRADVLDALRAADLFLLSSVSEGLNTATLEAMAVGLPVVVTSVGGMREAVNDGVEGLVVPPRDPAALTTAILALAADSERRREMGERGRKRIEADFDMKELSRAMHDEYQRIADQRARRLDHERSR